jgi:hypothetical protein
MAADAVSKSALPLLRRWVIDYSTATTTRRRDSSSLPTTSCELETSASQMRLFPGLGMTVHQTLAGENWAGVYFSQHGASRGRIAVWSGIAIYESDGAWLTGCVAQEDYMTRQRQLKSGLPDAVEAPAAAPWDVEPLPRDEAAEAAVRRWLDGAWPRPTPAVRCDDEHITGSCLRFEVTETEIDVLNSSGADVVFHARQSGRYLGGLAGPDRGGAPAILHVNGMLRVADGRVAAGRVIRDRAGLRAALLRGEAA